MSEAHRRAVESGYDLMAEQYLATKNRKDPLALEALRDLVAFEPETFDAVVAFHSIIHVPRTAHPALLGRIHRWLRPEGAFLATMTITDYEGRDEDWEGWGAPMVWSHYDADTNVAMLREAGFGIRYAEPRTGGGPGDESETWLWVLACKGATS